MPTVSDFNGDVLVLAGDVPLLTAATLSRLLETHRSAGAAATLLTAMLDDPTGYGRIVRNVDGTVARIVEHRDATVEERAIKEWNPSIYCFQASALRSALEQIRPNNVQGELYLTDAIGILASQGKRIEAVAMEDHREALGVNNRVDLAEVAGILRERILNDLMVSGVSIVDPATTYVDVDVQIGADTVIQPTTMIRGRTSIGEGCEIGPYSIIVNSLIGDKTRILASQVLESSIANGVTVGPWSNIRPGCRLADGVKIGDFVELKNAALGEKVSASHLSYIGDAEVGEKSNIGAGVVTCNYDGFRKHRTVIGKNAFIGTHTTLIAPVTVGDGAFIAAGSPINQDVPEDSLAIARSRPAIKPDWARKFRERNQRVGS
jgi:bifunctional UDP-N-acetylglucosamine pyrophosphorylase/glucosamine-1-phosphate N-acetyltransferase